jgi:CRISPR/Cas system-associated exonuclease Cas4 (RecB family)
VVSLADNFQFSATSLQDYVDCPRRFQLRYLLGVAWPAPQVEPALESERHARLGRDFHRLVHQHTLGVPEEALARSIGDPDLESWWRNYLAFAPHLPAGQRHPEVGLSVPLGGRRLVAQYDLVVAAEDGRVVIVDWKAYRRRPTRHWLAGRLQTKVYLYVMAEAGRQINTTLPPTPEQLEMVYWFANYPQEPERFSYDARRHAEARASLAGLIEEIVARQEEVWTLTPDEKQCLYCNYRSLCERGETAGHWDATETDLEEAEGVGFDFELDLGQVQEIEY